MATSESDLRCLACGADMRAEETVRHPKGDLGPVIETYACANEECKRRAVLIFEPVGGLSDDDRTFVEREVSRRGSFFPGDTFQRAGKFGRD